MTRRTLAVLEARPCGECNVCCTVLGVEEIEKPEQSACTHASQHGCAIYATRPRACAAYRCYWKLGILPIELRPDKVGGMITKYMDRFLAVYETRAGAALDGALGRYVKKRAAREPVFVRTATGWARIERVSAQRTAEVPYP